MNEDRFFFAKENSMKNPFKENLPLKGNLLIGYQAASEATGIPKRILKRMVERRSIRVIKETRNTVLFFLNHLTEDLARFEQPTLC